MAYGRVELGSIEKRTAEVAAQAMLEREVEKFARHWPLGETPREERRRFIEERQEAERPPSKKQRKATKGGLAKPRRMKIYERDGYRCVSCGRNRSELAAMGVGLTLDHIVPKSKGGTNAVDNLQTMCAPCNVSKADNVWNGVRVAQAIEAA